MLAFEVKNEFVISFIRGISSLAYPINPNSYLLSNGTKEVPKRKQ
jgi:hypothetical protein